MAPSPGVFVVRPSERPLRQAMLLSCSHEGRTPMRVGSVISSKALQRPRGRYRTSTFGVIPERRTSRITYLLIRPATGGTNRYRHWEPADDHLDWLWRVCGPMRGRRNLFGVIGGTGRFVNGVTRLTDGSTIHAQQNYVIFSDSKVETMILSTPIEVAWSPPIRDRSLEEWLADDRVQRIRELVIGKASTTTFGQRGLKTTNDQQAMQHLVLDNVSDVAGWRTAVRSVVTS